MKKCMRCKAEMKKTSIKYKGMQFEAIVCPTCKEKIFTEDLAMKAISKMESKRLEEEYKKKPIKIGHSWGITFPKDIVDVFDIPNSNITLHPFPDKGKIEIMIK